MLWKRKTTLPTSVFDCIKPSLLRTSTPAPKTTARTSFEVRTQQSDELSAFNEKDKITNYENFKSDILHHNFGCLAVVSKSKNEIYLQCDELLEGTGIFKLMIKIKEDFSYEAFHSGIKCIISSLSQNRITQLIRWSQVDEAVRFLKITFQHEKRLCCTSKFQQWVSKALARENFQMLQSYVRLVILLFLELHTIDCAKILIYPASQL